MNVRNASENTVSTVLSTDDPDKYEIPIADPNESRATTNRTIAVLKPSLSKFKGFILFNNVVKKLTTKGDKTRIGDIEFLFIGNTDIIPES